MQMATSVMRSTPTSHIVVGGSRYVSLKERGLGFEA
jgi:hypothetical protein